MGGKAGTVVKFAAPFGTGTLISLLREAIDIVAIKYSDADGGLHGAIFALPKGQATAVKEGLIAGEARRSMPVQFGVGVQRGSPGQLLPVSPGESRHKFSPVAIQIEQVESGHANLPPEFSIASYEKLVEEVQRTKKFRYVYRSGDRRAGERPASCGAARGGRKLQERQRARTGTDDGCWSDGDHSQCTDLYSRRGPAGSR